MQPHEMTPGRRVKVEAALSVFTGTVLDGGKIGKMFQIRPDDASSPTMTTWALAENCEPIGKDEPSSFNVKLDV